MTTTTSFSFKIFRIIAEAESRMPGVCPVFLDRFLQLTRQRLKVSECLPFLAYSGYFLNFPPIAILFFSGFYSALLPSLSQFNRVSAPFCLFGIDSFHLSKTYWLESTALFNSFPLQPICFILLYS
jgi:hypothetical protein